MTTATSTMANAEERPAATPISVLLVGGAIVTGTREFVRTVDSVLDTASDGAAPFIDVVPDLALVDAVDANTVDAVLDDCIVAVEVAFVAAVVVVVVANVLSESLVSPIGAAEQLP